MINIGKTKFPSDPELLTLAKDILEGQGYSVEYATGSIDLILAENPYFVIAIAAMNTIGELLLTEGTAEASLLQRLSTSAIGPKKWDAYLVLITQERSTEDDETTRDLYGINYDTSSLRRIAHTGVDATPEAVAHVLAPFVTPSEAVTTAIHEEPFVAMIEALATHGVSRELASRAVTAFEHGASLDDVL